MWMTMTRSLRLHVLMTKPSPIGTPFTTITTKTGSSNSVVKSQSKRQAWLLAVLGQVCSSRTGSQSKRQAWLLAVLGQVCSSRTGSQSKRQAWLLADLSEFMNAVLRLNASKPRDYSYHLFWNYVVFTACQSGGYFTCFKIAIHRCSRMEMT